jgi:hypothetical protein
MSSLVKNLLGKMLFHKPAIRTPGPLAAAMLVQRDNSFFYAKLFTAEPMIVLAVITGIGKHSLETHELMCLPDSGSKFRPITAGTAAYDTTGKK